MRNVVRLMRNRDFALAAVVAVALAGLTHLVTESERERLRQIQYTRISHEALALRARLESELNANVFLANGMVAHIIAVHGDTGADTTQRALRALFQYGRHIRNIGVAPDNRISDIHPRDGNEAAIGLYYPDVPAQWPAVERAIEEKTTILAGPIALRQGGTGLISRTPVFFPDGHYWGVISIVLDMDSLFAAVGMAPEINGTRFALRGKDGSGVDGPIFLDEGGLFSQDHIRFIVNVPGGSWCLAAAPTEGWNRSTRHLAWLALGGDLGAVVIGVMVLSYQAGRRRIAASERRLRAFMETTRDGVFVVDDALIIREFNPAAEALFGHSAASILGERLDRLLPKVEEMMRDDRGRTDDAPAPTTDRRNLHGVRRDGTTFPAEVSIGRTTLGRVALHVGVVRDITRQMATERRLLELATTDALTGVLNRRAFLQKAGDSFALAKRYHRPLSLLMIDADHFKSVNDTRGHHVGDAVLVALSRRVEGHLRATDRFGRFGGEEFVVLLNETTAEDAANVAERLVDDVRALEVADDAGRPVRITISVGVAGFTSDMTSIEDLLRRADAALYAAKSAGRDQWRVATLSDTAA